MVFEYKIRAIGYVQRFFFLIQVMSSIDPYFTELYHISYIGRLAGKMLLSKIATFQSSYSSVKM